MNIKLNDWQANTGEMPIEGGVKVLVKLRSGQTEEFGTPAISFYWGFDGSESDILEWKYADEEYFKRPKTASYSPDETKEEPVIKPVRIPEESIIVLRDAFNHMTGKSLTTEEVYGLALLIKLLGD